jgi:hypothetical protein
MCPSGHLVERSACETIVFHQVYDTTNVLRVPDVAAPLNGNTST